jgi:hypothetical protein
MGENERPTQVTRVLEHLKKHGSITTYDAFVKYGITRLSARIFEIRELGYGIKTKVVTGKDRYNEPTHWTLYELVRED